MRIDGFKIQKRSVVHVEYFAAHGMGVVNFDERVPRLYVVQLVGAHKAAEHHLAGNQAAFRKPHALRPQHDGALLAGLDLLFGLSHGTISHLALATVFGMYLCVIFELTGNIWVCVALHSVYNIAALSFYVPVPKALLSIYFVAGVALALIVFFMLCITYSDRIFSIAYMSDVTEDHRVPCPRCDSEHVKVYKKNLLFRRKARGRYLLSYQCKHCGWMANVSETGHEGFFNGKPVV